jgi:hypothetical protein
MGFIWNCISGRTVPRRTGCSRISRYARHVDIGISLLTQQVSCCRHCHALSSNDVVEPTAVTPFVGIPGEFVTVMKRYCI